MQDAVIHHNLKKPVAGANEIDARGWHGQGFATTATSRVVTKVVLPLWADKKSTGTFSIDIYDASGGAARPGSVVAHICSARADHLPHRPQNLTISGLEIGLPARTTYYLVVRGGADLRGRLRWSFTFSSSGVDLPSGYSFTVNAGVSWSKPNMLFPQVMKIMASGGGAEKVSSEGHGTVIRAAHDQRIQPASDYAPPIPTD